MVKGFHGCKYSQSMVNMVNMTYIIVNICIYIYSKWYIYIYTRYILVDVVDIFLDLGMPHQYIQT